MRNFNDFPMKKVGFLWIVFSCFVAGGVLFFGKNVFAACREVTCAESCESQLEVTNACRDEVLAGQTSSCRAQGKKACIPQSSVSSCPNFNTQCAASCAGSDDPVCANKACPTGTKYCIASANTCKSQCTTGQACDCVATGKCSAGTIISGTFTDCSTALPVCCKTTGGATPTVKCDPAKFKEYAGVCFPLNTGLSETSVAKIVINLMKWMLYLFGFLAIISFVISGIQYLVAAGNMNMIETAKRNMMYSIVGVIVALAGLVIIIAIDALLRGTAW